MGCREACWRLIEIEGRKTNYEGSRHNTGRFKKIKKKQSKGIAEKEMRRYISNEIWLTVEVHMVGVSQGAFEVTQSSLSSNS